MKALSTCSIGNPKIPNLFEEEEFVIGKGRKIREGDSVTLITTGVATKAAMEAADKLAEQGISVDLDRPAYCLASG